MQLILIKDVPHLGSLGDQVRVKDGFARNYLLPQGFAIAASSKNARQIAHKRKLLEVLRQDAIVAAEKEADKVGELELEIYAKAGANGRLFGSVTNRQIQAAMAEMGYDLDRRSITLHTPIKSVGTFGATVKLHSDVKTDISVKVLPIDSTAADLPEAGKGEDAPAAGKEQRAAPEVAQTAEGDPRIDDETPTSGESAASETAAPAEGKPDHSTAEDAGTAVVPAENEGASQA